MLKLIFKNLLLMIGFFGLTLFVIPLVLNKYLDLTFNFGAVNYLGFVLIALGLPLLIWSILNFIEVGGGTPLPLDPPKKFVATGPYKYIRNPMYIAEPMTIAGIGLLLGSYPVLIYSLLIFGFYYIYLLKFEEPQLNQKFGKEFKKYSSTTPRFIPRLK